MLYATAGEVPAAGLAAAPTMLHAMNRVTPQLSPTVTISAPAQAPSAPLGVQTAVGVIRRCRD